MTLSNHKRMVKNTLSRAKAAFHRSDKKKQAKIPEVKREEAEQLKIEKRRESKGKEKTDDRIACDDTMYSFLESWSPRTPPKDAHEDRLYMDFIDPSSSSTYSSRS
ncbi:hypothetical protein BY458DRAFT_499573 [Sporodiniella umbellata]|nr:hypothetical protein BY458DRAFT_499573 [Sporodiniella umbellata]